MTDWYTKGRAELIEEIVEECGVSEDQANSVYSFLSEIGIVDYDIEKDVIFDRYCSDEEE